jgi:hypothetical protein
VPLNPTRLCTPDVLICAGRLELAQALIAAGAPDRAVEHLLVAFKLNRADGAAKETLLKVCVCFTLNSRHLPPFLSCYSSSLPVLPLTHLPFPPLPPTL